MEVDGDGDGEGGGNTGEQNCGHDAVNGGVDGCVNVVLGVAGNQLVWNTREHVQRRERRVAVLVCGAVSIGDIDACLDGNVHRWGNRGGDMESVPTGQQTLQGCVHSLMYTRQDGGGVAAVGVGGGRERR